MFSPAYTSNWYWAEFCGCGTRAARLSVANQLPNTEVDASRFATESDGAGTALGCSCGSRDGSAAALVWVGAVGAAVCALLAIGAGVGTGRWMTPRVNPSTRPATTTEAVCPAIRTRDPR